MMALKMPKQKVTILLVGTVFLLLNCISSEGYLINQYHQHILYSPRHVHISYGNDPTSQMFITWVTFDKTPESIVEYGESKIGQYRKTGNVTLFNINPTRGVKEYVHRVLLTGLNPGAYYRYHCGSSLGWSDLLSFQAMKNGTNWSPRIVIYGDLGVSNSQSLSRIQEDGVLGRYDAIIHNGDFAYDMDSDDGLVGDAFMEQIQPIAGNFPYMTCPGNHEHRGNFLHYKNRFTMPGHHDSMMYSWNMGPIPFISFSTEVYYYLQYGVKPIVAQYEWLKKDLEEANQPENRAIRPWIITYGHRPMYCSNNYTDDCIKHDTLVRVGIPVLHMFGLEDILMDNAVDLAIWAHEHAYERMWPVYNYTVLNGSLSDPYKNPKGIVHVTTGSAGCKEKHSYFTKDMPEFTAFRSTDYGYSRLEVLNKTHLHWEQISDDQNGKIIDSFTIIRESQES